MENRFLCCLTLIRINLSCLYLLAIQATIYTTGATLTGCTSNPTSKSAANKSEQISSNKSEQVLKTQSGLASFIGEEFQGKKTTSGKSFNKNELVAAHPSYPMGTRVRITNLTNSRVIEVRVIDRSLSVNNQEGPIIDLSQSAAEKLGFVKDGRVRVRTEVLAWGGEHRD
jgi:rare lipoprotein A